MRFLLFLASLICMIQWLRLLSMDSNRTNRNLYIFKTCRGDVWCNYHNSRDTTEDGFIQFVEYSTKRINWIPYSDIDSIIVLREDFWSCGPRDPLLKYIDSTKNRR